MVTVASATGLPLSSAVTHTREASRPFLKCTARLVTKAAVATYMGAGFDKSAFPRI